MNWLYGAFVIATGASAIYLNFAGKLQLHKQWRALLIAFVVVCVPFLAEDVYATAQGHWSFSSEYILGPKLFNLPIEEIAFFVVVPLVMLCVWLLLKRSFNDEESNIAGYLIGLVGIPSLWLLQNGGDYSLIVGAVGIVFSVLILFLDESSTQRFWLFQAILLLLFFAANTLLTLPPIVSYGEEAINGLRIGSIPAEDFVYNFVLVNGFILAYEKVKTLLK